MEFTYDGGGLGKGGDVTLYLDGESIADGRVENTIPMLFSIDDTADVGEDSGTTVGEDYTSDSSRFTGKIAWVQIDIDAAAANEDHLIGPEERLRIAMARQ
jgi:arylsulfatase